MLNVIIQFALRQQVLIIALALVVLGWGWYECTRLPIDVFPDLDRPRVVILTECPGYAPEEVETQINIPLESVLNGATGVEAVRSSAGIGISLIFVEFDWGTDIFIDRQIVDERLDVVSDRLPEGIQPKLAPISSIMGQIMLVGMYVRDREGGEPSGGDMEADAPSLLRETTANSPATNPTSLLKLRELGDWVVRKRLRNIPGVAQVFTLGGDKRQVQVLVNPDQMRSVGVTLHQIEKAVSESNENATGGYVNSGSSEFLVRSLGLIESLTDLEKLVVDGQREPPVLLRQVAKVVNGPEIPRGTAAVNGKPAVMLVIVKQPGADTRQLTRAVTAAVEDLKQYSLPADVVIDPNIYRMDHFIDRAIENVWDALVEGFILVVIVLFLFLLNVRTTVITLTAIPLSIFMTVLIFRWFDLSINTMTLGGLAVAIGELVDDAIVDVENIYRRLRENRLAENPRPALRVVYDASVEIRSSIVFGTMIVVLVFVPLFALGGMEGRLFTPLAIAYIVSILASLLVSLTVTPVLAYWLLPQTRFMGSKRESLLLRGMQWIAGHVIGWSLRHPWPVIVTVAVAALFSMTLVAGMGRNFLPPFNEGSVQVSLALPPGTSLDESNRIADQVDRALHALEDVQHVGRRTGRAEDDEHVHEVYFSEIILGLDPDSPRSREKQLQLIREALASVPGVAGRAGTEQPISHLMSHMMSGVKAQIAIKIKGDDLAILRNTAEAIRAAIDDRDLGVTDVRVEPQVLVMQRQIKLNRDKLALRGLTPGAVNYLIQTAMQGRVVSQVLEGEKSFDLVVRLDDRYRRNLDSLRNLAVQLPSGGSVPLADVADFYPERVGPNFINRENGRRRIIIECNVTGRAVSAVRDEIQQRVRPIRQQLAKHGPGYEVEYGGQFESEQAATRMLSILSLVAIVGVFLVLYTLFRSTNLALQVMASLPMAAIGAVAALVITEQDLSVPSMVGFISLAGIASRNGILLISHYLHLVRHEGEKFTYDMIVRAGKERVAPVMMTALTSGIGLVPLALAADQPGKEILYPVATVIIGGLISSTLLDFFVRPALFWTFGRKAAARVVEADTQNGSLPFHATN